MDGFENTEKVFFAIFGLFQFFHFVYFCILIQKMNKIAKNTRVPCEVAFAYTLTLKLLRLF